jgi:hypothetical protein
LIYLKINAVTRQNSALLLDKSCPKIPPQGLETILLIESQFLCGSGTVNIKMDAYALLNIESVDETGPKAPKEAVEIIRGSRITLEWDKMYNRYVISLSKFKSEEQTCFAAKVNIAHIQKLQDGLNALVKYIEENNL